MNSELAALASAIEAGNAPLPPYVSRLIQNAPESFVDPRAGQIAVTVRAMRQTGEPITLVTIAEKHLPHLTFISTELPSAGLSVEAGEFYAEQCWQAYQVRRAKSVFGEAFENLTSSPDQASAIIERARDALDAVADETGNLCERLEARQFNIQSKPAEPIARFSIGSNPICTPGNLATISAPPKFAKSSFIGAMIAAPMTPQPETADCLGVQSRNLDGRALIHLDTEQSLFDHYLILSTALRRAGLTEQPPWLKSYCLTGFPILEARDCIARAMESAAKTCKGVHSVMLDGVADFVQDVNDPAESNCFVNELHALAIKFDCPIVGVIHLNPGSDKTRGHLGSQLERKAETNLRLERDGEAIVVWADKNRRAPISKDCGPRFQWNQEHQMHLSTETAGQVRTDAKHEELRMHAEAVFEATEKRSLRWAAFIEIYARDVLKQKLSSSATRKRFEEMIRAQIVRKNLIHQYELTP